MNLGWTSVKDYGAVGDGSADDTAAITAAIAALPNPGVLYFPPGTYKTSGGFTISTPCIVLGCGGGGGKTLNYQGGNQTVPHISQIQCTSQTAVLFTVSVSGVQFHDLSLVNTYAGTPSAGAAIQTVSGGGDHAQYVGVTFHGFYINLDHQYGREWIVERCYFLDPVYDGIRSQNLDAADEGEMTVIACQFMQQLYSANAAIDILRSGGHRISACLFFGLGPSDVTVFQVMVKCVPSSATSDLIITGCEMENWRDSAIYIGGSANPNMFNIMVTGCEFTDGHVNAQSAIGVVHVSRMVIVGNVFVGSGQAYPVLTYDTSVKGVVVGNYWEGYNALSSGTGVNAASNYS